MAAVAVVVLTAGRCMLTADTEDGFCAWWPRVDHRIKSGDMVRGNDLEREKGIRWMPWHQEAMKDVARCEKPWGAASRR